MENKYKPVRVLWFANTPGLGAGFLKISSDMGGWISALQQAVEAVPECRLGFVFYAEQGRSPFDYGATRYFPVRPLGSSKRKRFVNRVTRRAERHENMAAFLAAIQAYKPDIIHVHGTEFPFGLIQREVRDIPVVLSIQGNLTVYYQKYFAGMNRPGFWRGWRTGYPFYGADHQIWRKRMAIEQEIMRRTKFIFGRTDWDRRISMILAPQAQYFHVDEVIRPVFHDLEWAPGSRTAPVFLTTSSPSIYKGFEAVIDAARILVDRDFPFEWVVAGLNAGHPLVRLTCRERGVRDLSALHIRLTGTLSAEQLAQQLINSDVYVQVSHIENSPNSVCEAMLAGIPVIATFAGGTGSLMKDGVHGVLVQDGDPYVLAGAMQEVSGQPGRYGPMAAEARRLAQRRHDPAKIVREMMDRYLEIIRQTGGRHE